MGCAAGAPLGDFHVLVATVQIDVIDAEQLVDIAIVEILVFFFAFVARIHVCKRPG